MRWPATLLGLWVSMVWPAIVQAQSAPPLITQSEWQAYADRYISVKGRVIDDANGGISHSESQGYGLLLAYYADDVETFEQILSFAKTELMIRDDYLLAWRWDPADDPHVKDTNNATDGDILVAYALGLAGQAWARTDFTTLARQIANDIGKHAIVRWRGRTIMLPGVFGFGWDDRADGPVVNISYWIFEAFPLLSKLAPDYDWDGLAQQGRRLVAESRNTSVGLPADWMSLADGKPVPAAKFEADFGYNSIRIPLYLVRAGVNQDALLGNFASWFHHQDGVTTVNVNTQIVSDRLNDPGYQVIAAAVDCALYQTSVPTKLTKFAPTSYFASSLHLLALSYLRQSAPNCL